jgi:hypothetical protein
MATALLWVATPSFEPGDTRFRTDSAISSDGDIVTLGGDTEFLHGDTIVQKDSAGLAPTWRRSLARRFEEYVDPWFL